MTEEKKAPSFDEIQHSFFSKCQLHQEGYPTDYMPCPHCEYRCFGSNGYGGCNGDLDSQGSCERHYIYEVATGARDINKPLWNPPKTPEWFKVGQCVVSSKGDYGKIFEIEGGRVRYGFDHKYWVESDISEFVPKHKPVQLKDLDSFDEIMDELEALLGKTLRYNDADGYPHTELVTKVYIDKCDNFVNNRTASELLEMDATIDGKPVGDYFLEPIPEENSNP